MARSFVALAILALVAVTAFADPEYSDITGTVSPVQSLSYTTNILSYGNADSIGAISVGRYHVPYNAYAVYINATITDTAGTCYDYYTASASAQAYLQVVASNYFPCSYYYSNNYAGQGLSAVPQTLCNPTLYTGTYGNPVFTSNYDSFGYSSSTATNGFIVVNDYPTQWDASGSYVYGAYMGIYPDTDMFIGVNRVYTTSGQTVACDYSLQAHAEVCSGDTLPISSSGNSGTGAPGNQICVNYENITVPTTNGGVVNGSMITGNSGASSSSVNQVAYKLWNIPVGTSYIWVNISQDYNANSYYSYIFGASYLPSIQGSGYSLYESGGELGYGNWNYFYNSGSLPDSTNVITYYAPFMMPQWNQTYYVVASVDARYDAVISFGMVICADGFTGSNCNDPLVPLLPYSSSYSGTTGSTGYAHFYYDVPANTWNETVIIATAASGVTLQLRRNTYSQYPSSYFYINGGSGYSYNTYNSYSDNMLYVSGTTGIASNPHERYSRNDTRWVFTYTCGSSGYTSCSYSVNFNFTTSAVNPSAGGAAALVPFTVAILFALLAAFLF